MFHISPHFNIFSFIIAKMINRRHPFIFFLLFCIIIDLLLTVCFRNFPAYFIIHLPFSNNFIKLFVDRLRARGSKRLTLTFSTGQKSCFSAEGVFADEPLERCAEQLR